MKAKKSKNVDKQDFYEAISFVTSVIVQTVISELNSWGYCPKCKKIVVVSEKRHGVYCSNIERPQCDERIENLATILLEKWWR